MSFLDNQNLAAAVLCIAIAMLLSIWLYNFLRAGQPHQESEELDEEDVDEP